MLALALYGLFTQIKLTTFVLRNLRVVFVVMLVSSFAFYAMAFRVPAVCI